MMEVRLMREDEKHLAYALSSLAFMQGSRSTPWADDPNQPKAAGIGVWDERGFQAQVIVLSFRVHMGPDVVLPMGGIAGVACKPAARGRGYAKAALVRSLQHMRETGEVVSSLYPFSWEFYRQVGWEWVGVKRRYKAATRVLHPSPDTVRCREAGPADRPAIESIYRQFAARYRGMLARDEKQWNSVLDDTPERYTYTYLYEGEEGPEGYLTYRGGSHESTDLREFICLTARAQRAMLGLLGRLDMQTDCVEWRAPSDDLLWSAVTSYEIETGISPVTQARIVDVEAALKAWKPRAGGRGRFVMGVADDCADWNAGTWEVEFGDGVSEIRRARREPQFTLDIQALSQAFYGTPSAPEIQRAERVTVHDQAGFEAFSEFMSGPPMWTNDSF
jgi:predicted acetyltransferase